MGRFSEFFGEKIPRDHCSDVIMGSMASEITSLTIVYSTVYSSKKTSKLRVTGLCEENSPVTGEYPAQRASNAENVSIWWRQYVHKIRSWYCRHKASDIALEYNTILNALTGDLYGAFFWVLWRKDIARSLQWRHNGLHGVWNHQPQDCLLNGLYRCRSKETSKLRLTGLCEGNLPMTGEFPAQRASNAENISIWWRHHVHKIRAWYRRHKASDIALEYNTILNALTGDPRGVFLSSLEKRYREIIAVTS